MPNKQERRSVKRIDCYNRSIRNDEVEHSLLVDINNGGAGLLLLREQSLFPRDKTKQNPDISGDVNLTIFHPDISLHEGISVDANVVWVDYDYSAEHYKVGVKFSDVDDTLLDRLEEWLAREGHYYFHCELEKH